MKNEIEKQIENILLDLVGVANKTKLGQVTHKLEECKSKIMALAEKREKEVLKKVEEAYKESCVNVAANYGQKMKDKDIIKGFQEGSWNGFVNFYLKPKLLPIKEENK